MLVGHRTWTLTPLIDFEDERLLLYFLVFLLGALAFRQDLFTGKPQDKRFYTIMNSVAWIPITAHIIVRLIPFFSPGGFSTTPLFLALWWLSFYVALLCLMYLMIQSFRRYLDRTGWLWAELNRNSYGVYIIHVIMIGVFGTLLLNLTLPALLKYLLLIISTYVASNLAVSFYRGIRHTLRPGPSKSMQKLSV